MEIMTYLMEKGAPVNQADKSGRTALHWSSISGHKEATDILLAKVRGENGQFTWGILWSLKRSILHPMKTQFMST